MVELSYIIDTHLLYWWLTANPILGDTTTRILQNADIAVSTATLWEMVIKNRKGKLPLPDKPLHQAILDQGFHIIPITYIHVDTLRKLDLPHEDPFDLLLLATAMAEQRIFLTRDKQVLSFGLPFVKHG